METKREVLIWDLPTRLFHWLLVGGFTVAALTATVADEHGPLFPYHALCGLILNFMVVLRIVWGFLGSRYARFDSFLFAPREVRNYVREALLGGGERHVGHNPGSAYAILAMLTLVPVLAITGAMSGGGNKIFEGLHEFSANAMFAVVAAHILGVLLHTLRHRENIIAGMIHGRKAAGEQAKIPSSRPVVAGLFLVLTAAWSYGLVDNYTPAIQTTRLPLVGVQLKLGKSEKEKSHHGHHPEQRHDEQEDD
jgi:cytochrome b